MEALPSDVLGYVFSFVSSYHDWYQIMLVSKRWWFVGRKALAQIEFQRGKSLNNTLRVRVGHLSKCIALDPEFVQAKLWRGFFNVGLDTAQSTRDWKCVMKAVPKTSAIWHIAKSSYVEIARRDSYGAKIHLQRAFDQPNISEEQRGELHFFMGDFECNSANYEEAEKHFFEAVKRSYWLVNSHRYLGLTYESMNQDDKAVQAFTNSLNVQPTVRCLVDFANFYRKKKDYKKAKELCDRAVAVNPNYAEIYTELARLSDDLVKCEQLLRKADELDPEGSDVRYFAAVIADNGSLQNAIELLNDRIKKPPNARLSWRGELLGTRGWFQAESDVESEAQAGLNDLRQATKMDPFNQWLHHQLAIYLERFGQEQEALQRYQNAYYRGCDSALDGITRLKKKHPNLKTEDFVLFEGEDAGLLQDLAEYGTLFPSYVHKALVAILTTGQSAEVKEQALRKYHEILGRSVMMANTEDVFIDKIAEALETVWKDPRLRAVMEEVGFSSPRQYQKKKKNKQQQQQQQQPQLQST